MGPPVPARFFRAPCVTDRSIRRAACDTFGRAQENPVLQEATASEPLTIEVRIGGQRTILQHRLWPACAWHRLSNSG